MNCLNAMHVTVQNTTPKASDLSGLKGTLKCFFFFFFNPLQHCPQLLLSNIIGALFTITLSCTDALGVVQTIGATQCINAMQKCDSAHEGSVYRKKYGSYLTCKFYLAGCHTGQWLQYKYRRLG